MGHSGIRQSNRRHSARKYGVRSPLASDNALYRIPLPDDRVNRMMTGRRDDLARHPS
jgi:hypothetical protein